MSLISTELLQTIAWFLALVELILALYILLLNARHSANCHVSILLLLFATNSFALGLLFGAQDAVQATLPTYLLAATSSAVMPGLLLVTVILLKPQWLLGGWRWIWWPAYGLAFLPLLLTFADILFGTGLWYIGLDAKTYRGGFAELSEFAAGTLSAPIRSLSFMVTAIVTLLLLLYIALLDREVSPLTRRLAWLLLGAQAIGMATQFGLAGVLTTEVSALITSIAFVFGYAYAAFQQVISERRLQKGRLQTRLTALILVITVPILIASVAFVNARAGALINQFAVQEQEAELLSALGQFRQVSWAMLAVGVVMLLVLAWLTIRQALQPISTLTETTAAISAGDLSRVAPVESEDEVGALARAFNSMTQQLRELIGSLEQQVADRTRDLEQRSAYLEATAEVSRAAASVLNRDRLAQEAVELIRERFGLYYVGLFLVDEAGEWAVLQAGTGDAGQAMLARGHRIRVGKGMIGWSVVRAQPRVAPVAGEDAVRLATPELPHTRSEAALPLRSRERVLGALTVQHTKPGAFDPDTMAVLQTMADQVAVALDNAQLFAESQAALEATQRAYGELSRRSWREMLEPRGCWGYRYAHQVVARVDGDWRPEMLQASQTGQTVLGSAPSANPELGQQEPTGKADGPEGPRLAIPLKVRDEVVGVLGFRKRRAEQGWTAEEVEVLEAFAAQLELALDSARLYQDSQGRAAEERLTSQIGSHMRETLDVDTVLRTAIREMGAALGLQKVEVRMAGGVAQSGNGHE